MCKTHDVMYSATRMCYYFNGWMYLCVCVLPEAQAGKPFERVGSCSFRISKVAYTTNICKYITNKYQINGGKVCSTVTYQNKEVHQHVNNWPTW